MTGSHDATPGHDASGWLEALAFVIAVSVLNVLYAYAVARGVHVVVFVLYAMIGTSAVVLAMSGLGADALRVVSHPASWVYGIATVALEGVYFLLVGLISPAEASLTARLSVPMSLLVAWAYFSARLKARQIVGSLIVVAAVALVLAWVPADNRNAAIILGVLTALVVAIKTYASEYHPWNRRAGNITEKVRVTGLVVLAATSLGVLATAFGNLSAMASSLSFHPLYAIYNKNDMFFVLRGRHLKDAQGVDRIVQIECGKRHWWCIRQYGVGIQIGMQVHVVFEVAIDQSQHKRTAVLGELSGADLIGIRDRQTALKSE